MRPGQNNFKNRNRNRNRRHGGGGGNGGGGGGNSNNRVLDSNGPDVKLRGTAQTIAEKYMQLARDATSSGDRVMAESYFQHADHYYRLWLAAQPPGQPIVFGRRPDEDNEDGEGGEGDDETSTEAAAGEGSEGSDATPAGDTSGTGDAAPGEEGANGQQRNFRPRNGQDQNGQGRDQSRDQGRGFRNRWPRRNDRNSFEPRDGQTAEAPAEAPERLAETAERPERVEGAERMDRPPRRDRQPRRERSEDGAPGEAAGDWEAPSFLKRPMPPVADEASGDVVAAPERKPRAKRPRYGEEGVEPNEPPSSDE
jgi:hypothetical protein